MIPAAKRSGGKDWFQGQFGRLKGVGGGGEDLKTPTAPPHSQFHLLVKVRRVSFSFSTSLSDSFTVK